MNKQYTVAMPQFIAEGGDGYSMFESEDVKIVVDDENAMRIVDIVKQFFKRTEVNYKVQ